MHASEAEGREFLRGEGTRFPSVVLPAVLEPNLRGQFVMFEGWLFTRCCKDNNNKDCHIILWLEHTWTSFSFSETRSTMS